MVLDQCPYLHKMLLTLLLSVITLMDKKISYDQSKKKTVLALNSARHMIYYIYLLFIRTVQGLVIYLWTQLIPLSVFWASDLKRAHFIQKCFWRKMKRGNPIKFFISHGSMFRQGTRAEPALVKLPPWICTKNAFFQQLLLQYGLIFTSDRTWHTDPCWKFFRCKNFSTGDQKKKKKKKKKRI